MKNTRTTRRGFSLIELLVVIAIIAILAAVTFPAIVATKNRARRSACASNMHNIAGGLKVYRLDEGAYPMALYAFGDVKSGKVVTGLWPHWVQSPSTFVCPNNPVLGRYAADQSVRLLESDGSASPAIQKYPARFAANELHDGAWTQAKATDAATLLYPSGIVFPPGDSYDFSLLPTSGFQTNTGTLERHYQIQWVPKLNLGDTAATSDPANQTYLLAGSKREKERAYARQLVFKLPDDTTMVTICTYHRDYPNVPAWQPGDALPNSSQDNVLFLDGHVETRVSQHLNYYADVNGTRQWAGWQLPSTR